MASYNNAGDKNPRSKQSTTKKKVPTSRLTQNNIIAQNIIAHDINQTNARNGTSDQAILQLNDFRGTRNQALQVEFKDTLQKKYGMLQLPTVPWLNEGKSLHIDSHYVQLKLSEVGEIIPLNDVFKDTREDKQPRITRILIEGQPGFGKTTLCHKLAKDWAAKTPYTQQFEIVVLIVLSQSDRGTLMKRVNKEVGGQSEKETWDIINNVKTLLILDGLDEMGKKERSDVLNILYEAINKMTVVATSRTGQFGITREDKKKMFGGVSMNNEFYNKGIEILGISDENRVKFLSKFTQGTNKDKTVELVQKITQSLKKMFHSPLLLILLAYVIEELGEIKIETTTDVYKMLCDCLIRRNLSKKEEGDGDFWKQFSLFKDGGNRKAKRYQTLFSQFGKLSIEHLLQNNLQFDVRGICDEIYEMGFLVKYLSTSTFNNSIHYEGLHLSIVEFSAAFALWTGYKAKKCIFEQEAVNDINRFLCGKGEFTLVIPFLCGLLGENANNLFGRLSQYSVLHSTCRFRTGLIPVFEEWKMDEMSRQHIAKWAIPVLDAGLPANLRYRQDYKIGVLTGGLQFLRIFSYQMDILPADCKGMSIWVNVSDSVVNTEQLDMRLQCKRILFEFTDIKNLETVEKYLKIFDSITAEEKLLHVVNSSLQLKVLRGLQKLNITNKIHSLYCELTIQREGKQFIKRVINKNNLENLILQVKSEKFLDRVLDVISDSSNLKTLTIKGSVPVDLVKLTKQNTIKELSFNGVAIGCTSVPAIPRLISSFACDRTCTYNSDVHRSVAPEILYCDDKYIFDIQISLSSRWEGWNSLKELTLMLHSNVSCEELFKNLSLFTQIQILSLNIMKNLDEDALNAIVKCSALEKIIQLKLEWRDDCTECAFDLIRRVADLINTRKLKKLNILNIIIVLHKATFNGGNFEPTLNSILSCVSNKKIQTLHIESNNLNTLHFVVLECAGKDFSNFLRFRIEHTTTDKFSTDFNRINHIVSISLLPARFSCTIL